MPSPFVPPFPLDNDGTMAQAVAAAGDGVWDWDVPTGRVFFSHRWKAMLGYADDEIGGALDEWKCRVHPDDLPRVMADVKAHLDSGAPTPPVSTPKDQTPTLPPAA